MITLDIFLYTETKQPDLPTNKWSRESLGGELFYNNCASVAVQCVQTQSISTSDRLVWSTCLRSIQLNTWKQVLARRSDLGHLSWNVSEYILLLLLTLHTSVLGFPQQ